MNSFGQNQSKTGASSEASGRPQTHARLWEGVREDPPGQWNPTCTVHPVACAHLSCPPCWHLHHLGGPASYAGGKNTHSLSPLRLRFRTFDSSTSASQQTSICSVPPQGLCTVSSLHLVPLSLHSALWSVSPPQRSFPQLLDVKIAPSPAHSFTL